MFKIDKRLLLYCTLVFFVLAIIGPVSRNAAHYFTAKLMGFDAGIDYEIYWLNECVVNMTNRQYFWYIAAGPLQTMLIGAIGFLWLLRSRSSINKQQLTTGQWVLIFLSLFWVRQTISLIAWLTLYVITGVAYLHVDEIMIARLSTSLPNLSILVVTALPGLYVAFVVFRIIPKSKRFTFILSGVIGVVLAYFFWFVYFGKYIMPES